MAIHGEIGGSIVTYRKGRRASRKQLTSTAKISISYLHSIERGETNPTVNGLLPITEILDLEPRHLYIIPESGSVAV